MTSRTHKLLLLLLSAMLALGCLTSRTHAGEAGGDEDAVEAALTRIQERFPFLYRHLAKLKERDPEACRRRLIRLNLLAPDEAATPGNNPPRNGAPRAGGGKRGTRKFGSRYEKEENRHASVPDSRTQAIRAQLRELRRKYLASDNEAERNHLRDAIRQAVEDAFDATTARRRQILRESEQRLAEAQAHLEEAQASLERRTRDRSKHIRAFIDGLLEPEGEALLQRGSRQEQERTSPSGETESRKPHSLKGDG